MEVAAPLPYVSRGGEKLAAALDAFGVDPAGLVCLDVGASTGGFTDACCSAAPPASTPSTSGAASWPSALRRDPRVVSRERTNARELTPAMLGEPVAVAVVDVSFISLGPRPAADRRLPRARRRGRRPGEAPVRGRPGTRAGWGRPRSGGPPRGPRAALAQARAARLVPVGLADSPLLGPAGNREFFLHAVADAGAPGARGVGRPHRRAGAGMSDVRRIGFAYNPTKEDAVELSARATGWCAMRGSRAGRWPRGTRRRSSRRSRRSTCSSSSAVTGPSCGRPGRSPRSRCRSSASTSARSASCRRPRPTSWRSCSRRSWPGASTSRTGWRCAARSSAQAGDDGPRTFIALNDVVIARGALARVVHLDVEIGPSHLATFIADGLVVASPTGSTGYSFSAGGPILDPLSRNLIVTPIAAYLSALGSVVVSPDQVVRCRVLEALEALVSIDGREDYPLGVG